MQLVSFVTPEDRGWSHAAACVAHASGSNPSRTLLEATPNSGRLRWNCCFGLALLSPSKVNRKSTYPRKSNAVINCFPNMNAFVSRFSLKPGASSGPIP